MKSLNTYLTEKLIINKNFVQVGNPDDDIIDDIIDRNLWDNKDEKLNSIMKFGCPMSMFNTAWGILCNELNVYGTIKNACTIIDIKNKVRTMYNSGSKYPILNFLRSDHVKDMFDDFEKANIHTEVLLKETPSYDVTIEWLSTEKYDMLFFGKHDARYHIFLHRKK